LDVRWRKADIPDPAINVRFRGIALMRPSHRSTVGERTTKDTT